MCNLESKSDKRGQIMRKDGRKPDEMRPVLIERNYTKFAHGSVLIQVGDTRVICTASVDEGVPPHKRNTGQGWVTAEYSLLPGSTPKESFKGILTRQGRWTYT